MGQDTTTGESLNVEGKCEVTNHNESLPNRICKMSIGKTKTYALVDSGSDKTLISFNVFRKIDKNLIVDFHNETNRLTSASGHPLPSAGVATLTVTLGTYRCLQNFHVIKNLSKPAILGSDFLVAARADTNWGEMYMTLKPGNHVVLLEEKNKLEKLNDDQCMLVSSKQKTCIPPHTMVRIPVRMQGKQNLCFITHRRLTHV